MSKNKTELSPGLARAFNLAAFSLPFFYNLVYNRPYLAVIFIILTVLPHTVDRIISSSGYIVLVFCVSILTLLFALISGITGNKAAYTCRDYDNEEDFVKSQHCWVPVTIIAIIIHILILPIQITGHTNTAQMIRLAEAKDVLKTAIIKGKNEGYILGETVINQSMPQFFAAYLDGRFNGTNTVRMSNGVTYQIQGHLNECGKIADNHYYENKTACATITIDLNGRSGPNIQPGAFELEEMKNLFNRSTKLGDIYKLFVYEDGLMPAEGSIEQYILKRFERK